MRVILRLMSVLGKRTFLTFGVVTLLVGGLLAATELTSRYALKLFVEDQLRRIPWDVAVYQRGGVTLENEVPDRMRAVPRIQRVESLAFLRASFPPEGQVSSQVDGQPLNTPWICMIAASDPSILPPKLQFALEGLRKNGQAADEPEGGVMALVGPERAISSAFLSLQGARVFDVNVDVAGQKRNLFSIPIHGVIRQERDELNRWFMDQIGTIAFVPYISTIFLTSFHSASLAKFDSVATGVVPMDMIGPEESQYGHVQPAEYEPEMIYLGKVDRANIISGWDIGGSLARMTELRDQLSASVETLGATELNVDSTTLVLLERMNGIARLIGIVTILVALPLLWMAWVLAANLSNLLMLNERRMLGLMRLRGIPSHLMGRALVFSVVAGGLCGGIIGLVLGSVIPGLVYEGHLSSAVLFQRQQLILLASFLVITIVLALEVSRRFVLYATSISPLEASGRIATSETGTARVRFGVIQAMALVLGAYKLASWIFDFSVSASSRSLILKDADRGLDFVALPLLLYGAATLLVSHRGWIQSLLAPLVRPIGGRLGKFALRQIAVKPHRTVAFLFIVALMTSVSLYPIIAARSFQEKAVRGAMVNLGADWQYIFNSPDLAGAQNLQGSLGDQVNAIGPGLQQLENSIKQVPGVRSASFLMEAVLPNFYLPGYGLRGVPLYLVSDPQSYLKNVYSEPELGLSDKFANVVNRFQKGDVAASIPVEDFWQVPPGKPLILGRDGQQKTLTADVAGVLAFLPGMPPRSVTDRQSYVQDRLDYLNFLFESNAYVVAAAADPHIRDMRVLIPRVIMLLSLDGSTPAASVEESLRGKLPFSPLEIHNLHDEVQKAGSDMFIFLALENMKIYLVGGLILALIGIVAVATANYIEEQHTLALLRIRGTPPKYIWRFLMAMFISPAILGVILGAGSALIAGYGVAGYLWKLREIRTVVAFLKTHMVVSAAAIEIIVVIMALLIAVATGFNSWVFRSSAREHIQKG